MSLSIRIQGHLPPNALTVHTQARCGAIDDGLAFSVNDHPAWVISFEDFVRIYREACRVRHKRLLLSGRKITP